MTEAEWLTSAEPFAMLDTLHGWSSDRKIRLFACGCCPQLYHSMVVGPSHDAVSVAELHADGLCTDDELTEANRNARLYVEEVYGDEGYWSDFGCLVTEADPWDAVHYVTRMARYRMPDRINEVRAGFRALILDILGNPYQRVDFGPHWRTTDAIGLARGIYEDRAFERLPLLADALMDAGCDDEQVIGHCGSDGPHVRGCWVVDLVLGKE